MGKGVALLGCSVVVVLLATGGRTKKTESEEAPGKDCVLSNPPWSDCSKNCGGGVRMRHRKVEAWPLGEGRTCSSFSAGVITLTSGGTYYREREACNSGKCQDCVLSDPGWSDCTKNCGGGEHTRDRRVETWPQGGGRPCSSYSNGVRTNTNSGTYFRERKPCNTRKCQDCVMNHWGSWGACSGASCYPGGTQTRRRSVKTNPEAGGKACPRLSEEEQTCNTQACPGPLVTTTSTSPDETLNPDQIFKPLVPDEILEVDVGDPVFLDCKVENGSSISPLTWRKGEEELESRDGLHIIPKLARDQAGTYVCSDNDKQVIKSVRIEVSEPLADNDQTTLVVGLAIGITVLILGGLAVGCYCRQNKTTTPVPERGIIERNEIYGLYHRGFGGEGDYGDGDVVEIVDNNPEYGHVEEGDVGEIVDNNVTYGH